MLYMDKNTVKITIGGMNYSVITDNEPQYTEDLAAEIDAKLSEILGSNKSLTINQAVVLLALEYADKYKKCADEGEALKERLRSCLSDAAEAKTERDALRRENERLKKIKTSVKTPAVGGEGAN